MSNLLIDPLPHHVEIGGAQYPINYDFRTSVRFELLMQEGTEGDTEKLVKALKLYYGENVPKDVDTAVERLVWFYSCGSVKASSNGEKSTENHALTRAYSFKHDAEYVYSAFYQQYGIDLSMSKMHWWQFKALFNSLTEDCIFTKIMHYRTVKITSKMPKSEQERLRQLKRIYALPLVEAEQKRMDELERALMGDGDISKLL